MSNWSYQTNRSRPPTAPLKESKSPQNSRNATANLNSTPVTLDESSIRNAFALAKKEDISPSSPVDVWKGEEIDPSRVDRILQNLKHKIETINSFQDDVERAVRKIFAIADVEKDGQLSENEFKKLLIEKMNFAGAEKEVSLLFRRFDTDRTGSIDVNEFIAVIMNKPVQKATTVIGRIREILARRAGGASSLKSLALQFKLMDDGNGLVTRKEMEVGFHKFLNAYGVKLNPKDLDLLFIQFDANNDGNIDYNEFVFGIRGGMNDFRTSLVKQVFDLLDTDKSGAISIQEIASRYDVSKHPLVLQGKITPTEALRIFLSNWRLQNKKQLVDEISEADFIEYYNWVSSSIDSDDYFELMMRNAWHISGGSDWSANTSNLRVLVTHEDGRESIETVENDLGVSREDTEKIKSLLRSQGLKVKSISLKY